MSTRQIVRCFYFLLIPLIGNATTLSEFIIDTSATYSPALYDQWWASMTFDGTNYFVVWQDGRYSNFQDVFGARVSPSGTLIDPGGIPIVAFSGVQNQPSVAFGGNVFLVVWETDINFSSSGYDIYGTRVSQTGEILDTTAIPICFEPYGQINSSVAFDGVNFFVVWQDFRDSISIDIYGTRISPDGVILDPMGIAVSTAHGDQRSPCLAYDGTNYFITWQDRRGGTYYDIYGARVTTSGFVLDSAGIAISTADDDQETPSVVFGGINYFVVWDHMDSEIYGARVATDGTLLDSAGIFISSGRSQAVSCDSTNYFVAWADYQVGTLYNIYGARVSQAGEVLDPPIPLCTVANHQYFPAVAYDGANHFVVWEDERDGSADIFGGRVSPSGVVLEPDGFIVTEAANDQWYPSVSFDGTNYFAVWMDHKPGNTYYIYGMRMTPTGERLDPVGLPIAPVYYQTEPDAAYDGTNYLVTWMEYQGGFYDIYGARVTPSGTMLDPAGIPISTEVLDQQHPDAAFNRTNYLVVWDDRRVGFTYDIYGARVTPSGTVLDPSGIVIAADANFKSYPAVSSDANEYFVVWHGAVNLQFDIFGVRVASDGSLGSIIPIASEPASEQRWPAVAFGAGIYFVIWSDSRNTGMAGYNDIYGARVTTAGNVLDPTGIPICTAVDDQSLPAVTFDGTNFVVCWRDRRNGLYYKIYGARVDTAGAILDSFNILSSVVRNFPEIAAGPTGQNMIVFYGLGEAPYGSQRTYASFYFTIPGINLTSPSLPTSNILLEISPNPFSEKTEIRFTDYDLRSTMISVYDVSGRLVRSFPIHQSSLCSQGRGSPFNQITWSGDDDLGRRIPPGVYFIRLNTDDYQSQQKVIFVH